MFATAYVTIFLKKITNVSLMRAFLRHLLLGRYDGRSIMDALTQNISKPNHLVGERGGVCSEEGKRAWSWKGKGCAINAAIGMV